MTNLNLLYVEDDEETIDNIDFFLKRHFNEIIIAQDGEEAFNYFKEKKPDIIILPMFLLPQISIYFPFFFQRVTLGVLPFTFELLAPLKLLLKFFALCAYETILDVPTPEPCFPK